MNRKRTALSAVIATIFVAAPLAGVRADPAYIAFPPFWPLITIGAIIESATAVARGAPAAPCCYYGPPPCPCVPPAPASYYPAPAYNAPGPYQPGYYRAY